MISSENPRESSKVRKYGPMIGVLVALAGAAAGATLYSTHARPLQDKQNLFTLVGSLSGTTDSMLNHTRQLSNQISAVQTRLGQLNTQTKLLDEQKQTGEQLANQLNIQVQLTENGVSLMQRILQEEQRVGGLTGSVASASSNLGTKANDSSMILINIQNSLSNSNQSSLELASEMGNLLNELNTAESEFHIFGQLNQLLGSAGSLAGLGGILGNQTIPNASKGLSGILGGLGHSSGNTLGNTLGSTLGNTLGNSLGNTLFNTLK